MKSGDAACKCVAPGWRVRSAGLRLLPLNPGSTCYACLLRMRSAPIATWMNDRGFASALVPDLRIYIRERLLHPDRTTQPEGPSWS